MFSGLFGGVLRLRRRIPRRLPPATHHGEDQERPEMVVHQLSEAGRVDYQRFAIESRQPVSPKAVQRQQQRCVNNHFIIATQ